LARGADTFGVFAIMCAEGVAVGQVVWAPGPTGVAIGVDGRRWT
jgi:hypothetical protein